MIYKMKLADSVDEMTFDLLEVPIEDKDVEGTADNTTIDGNVFTDYLWLKKQFIQKWSLMCEDDYTQLRRFYTRQWENAEVPTYKLFVGENRSETLTASGSAFQIQNGTQYDAPLTLTEITGNATQNGTPTPDAPVAVNTTTGEQVVKITGKNLFPNITWTPRVAYPVAQSGDIAWWTGYCGFQDYVSVLPNTTYTFSNAENIGFTYGLQFYDSNKTWISGINNRTKTFTTPANCRYIRGSTDIATAPTNCQLELGSTATAYEPYQGQEFPIDLGSIELAKIGTYKDRIYKNDGKWYVEKQVGKVVLNGTQTITRQNDVFVFYGFPSGEEPASETISGQNAHILVISDKYTGQKTDYRGSCLANHILKVVGTGNNQIAWNDTRYTITADMTTWLASNPTTVYYALATPTTTEITDSTLLAQLNFIANLYGGTNNIMLVGTGAQGEIGVEYTLTYEKEQTIIPETPVRLNLTDGGVINTCGCRQNVQLTMRETIQ